MMGKLYYFQAPNFDINPDSQTAPRLGSIFSNRNHLTAPLIQDDRLPIPQRLLNQSIAADFSDVATQSFQAERGVNATAGQGITGSAEIVYAFAQDGENAYHCEFLETVEFAPDDAFVSESIVASQRVQRFLENSIFGRKRVYMITGLKIASGFSRSSSAAAEHGPSLRVGVSGAALGVPVVEAGPGVALAVGSGRTVEQGQTRNKIVFAYRVIRIRVRWDGEARYRYKSGGKYSVEEDSQYSDEDEQGKWVMEPLDEELRYKDFPDSVRIEIEE